MDNKIFREKNLERISSAENLNEVMHVTSPRLWMLLVTILTLVVGFIVFACVVSLENTVDTRATVDLYKADDLNAKDFNEIDIAIPDSLSETIHLGMSVRLGDMMGTITSLYSNEVTGNGAVVKMNDPNLLLPEGDYNAKIILETIHPISFLFN